MKECSNKQAMHQQAIETLKNKLREDQQDYEGVLTLMVSTNQSIA